MKKKKTSLIDKVKGKLISLGSVFISSIIGLLITEIIRDAQKCLTPNSSGVPEKVGTPKEFCFRVAETSIYFVANAT